MKTSSTAMTLAIVIAIFFSFSGLKAEDVLESKSLKILNPELVVNTPLELYDSSGNLGDMLFVLDSHLKLQNKTTNYLKVKFGFEIISLQAGHSPSMCWGKCYAPLAANWPPDSSWSENGGSIHPSIMDVNETTDYGAIKFTLFTGGSYLDGEVEKDTTFSGTSVIRGYFYVYGDRTDSVSIIITYNVSPTLAVKENPTETSDILKIFPNPANDKALLSFTKTKNFYGSPCLEIWDVLGRMVKSEKIDNDVDFYDLKTNDLPQGNYYLILNCNGIKTISKPLIVTR